MYRNDDSVAREYGLLSFNKLNRAATYIREQNIIRRSKRKEELRVFAREYAPTRKRYFIASTISDFFYKYL